MVKFHFIFYSVPGVGLCIVASADDSKPHMHELVKPLKNMSTLGDLILFMLSIEL